MTDEEWRQIDWIEGADDYFISSRGRFKRGRKLRKQSTDGDGYKRCNIGKNKYRVHRLVAMAFIPNPDNLPVIDHIDGNKTNNNVENLRWVDYRENTQAAFDMGLNPSGKKRDILVLDSENNASLYESQVEASKATGVPAKAISKVCRGVEKSRGGYRFFSLLSFIDYRIKDTKNNN